MIKPTDSDADRVTFDSLYIVAVAAVINAGVSKALRTTNM